MDAFIPLALSLAPELARWLFGDGAPATISAVAKAIQTATGTSDPQLATSRLQQDPKAASDLRILLAQITASQEQAAQVTLTAALAATLKESAPNAGPAPAQAATWSTPVISAVVLLTFAGVVAVVLLRGMPAGSETAVNMLLGTLAAMATSVVSYWVGSSAGSARKDDRLAQAGK